MTERLGDLRLLELLGRGGMGAVWRAEHVETGARYAVKVVEDDRPDARLRFQREVEAQARVDRHANVARVHSSGQAGRRSFCVLELLEGGDLGARLQAGPLAPAEVVALGRALARGLAHVHARGILHRDLKPSNVLFDAQGTPKLVDFGLARIAGEASLTATGTFVGTPAYTAPEQVDGRADARADVYGLGALLFHAAAGRPPFEGATALAVLSRLQRGPTPRASSVRPGLPAALDDLLAKAMARDPSGRFQDAAALADALDQVDLRRAPAGRGALVGVGVALGLLAPGLLALLALAPRSSPAPVEPAPVATSAPVTDLAPKASAPDDEPERDADDEPAADVAPAASADAALPWPADLPPRMSARQREAWAVWVGQELAAGSRESRRVERLRLGERGFAPAPPLALPRNAGSAAAAGPDGRLHVAVTRGVVAIDGDAVGPPSDPGPRKNAPRTLAVSPGGRVAAAWLQKLYVLDRGGCQLELAGEQIRGLAWLDERRLAVVSASTGGDLGLARLCAVDDGRVVLLLEAGRTGPLNAVIAGPAPGQLYAGGTQARLFAGEAKPPGVIYLCDAARPGEARPLVEEQASLGRSSPSTVRGLALLGDGLVSVSKLGLLRRWRGAPSGVPTLAGELQVGQARGLSVSADGRWVAVAHEGDAPFAVTLWRVDRLASP